MKAREEQEKAYKKAYAWALKVQKACLLKPVDITVKVGYCSANERTWDISANTITVCIWDSELKEHFSAEWATFRYDFEDNKKVVEAYLKAKGITIK